MKATSIGIVLIAAAIATGSRSASAQQMAAGALPPGNGPPQFVGSYRDPAVAPAGCDACDAYGNPIGGGYFGGAAQASPYGAFGGGGGYDQCGPHYYDFSADALYLRRDNTAEPNVAFTAQGVNGPRVLTTSNVKHNEETGFRVSGRLDMGPVSLIEASFFGTLNWGGSATVTSGVNDLFSPFSQFGLNPFLGVGFSDTDQASLHRITYLTELNNAEINYRWYWLANHPAISGTVLMGARYLRLTEDFIYHTETSLGMMDYTIATENDLVGFQVGGDAAICIAQGLRAVAEAKIGIYNNRIKQNSRIAATSLPTDIVEGLSGNTVAAVGEGNLGFVADVLPSISVRGGIQVLWINSLALAPNQFNAAPPPFTGGANTRVPFLNDGGRALFYGLYAGGEYVW